MGKIEVNYLLNFNSFEQSNVADIMISLTPLKRTWCLINKYKKEAKVNYKLYEINLEFVLMNCLQSKRRKSMS